MSIIVEDKNGNDVEVYAECHGGVTAFDSYDEDGNGIGSPRYVEGGWIRAYIRAASKAAWETAALSRNLLRTLDGAVVPSLGVEVVEIGSLTLTPAVMDEDGETVLTPAVIDSRWHANLTIGEPALSVLDEDGEKSWIATGKLWTVYGTEDDQVNASETALDLYDVGLIDPATISSHSLRHL